MNSHSLVTTHLRDEIVNLTHICGADPIVYLKALPEKDQKLIADVRKYYSKGEEPWYPLTRKYLARLVYDVSGMLSLFSSLTNRAINQGMYFLCAM